MLETAVKTNIDVGRVNDRYFINVVGAGSISEAVGKVTIKEKTLFGSLAYYMKGHAGSIETEILPFQN